MEPRIEVDASAEGFKPVVGHDDEDASLVELFPDLPDEFIHLAVQVFDDLPAEFCRRALEGRMTLIKIPIEHVLNAVGGLEYADDGPFLGLGQRIEQHPFPFFVVGVGQFEKRTFLQGSFVEGPGVVRLTQGNEAAEELAEIDGIDKGMRYRESGLLRVDIQRSHVHLKVRLKLGNIESGDSLDFHPQARSENDFYPGRELSELEGESLSFDIQSSFFFFVIHFYLHRNSDLFNFFKKRILWP